MPWTGMHLYLSQDTDATLDALCSLWGLSRSQAIARALREAQGREEARERRRQRDAGNGGQS